ncbi:xanthine dehydrogenase family protein molybdopterin-binding subunit [Aureimonas pseudogalii]|uniref:Xanthine dehydrogenase YagR molybdenum-binding subunit n=1 Tax=Aureimonas pseudogalii TaxID=1744844 RepID=A0A7W6H5I2_9HYPH|nr:xanthine dehydrogenase family protein molybdopterin-binding subunit [Aureimonas pseudogalii]MBB3998947.1 xanthine dehydrogenase YagR molybdenum-binding subunit [Aureimonas pseudogalii]
MDTHSIKMDEPIGETRLDRGVQNVIGKGIDRLEGPLKVSGKAPYAYEHQHASKVAYGYLVTSSVGSADIVSIDTDAAMAMPGVLHVVIDKHGVRASADPSDAKPAAIGGKVTHFGQPICLVVAESFEIARDASRLVHVEYKETAGKYDLHAEKGNAFDPGEQTMPSMTEKGDFDTAFGAAEVTFDATYTTPSHSHSAMEPHTSVAVWDGDDLTLYGSYQLVCTNVGQLAAALGINKKHVRIVSPYVGGGFGGKLGISPEAVFAALAAKEIDRPVKLALTRQQVYQVTSRRPDTIQRVRIGTTKEGVITAIGHDTTTGNTPGDDGFEPAGISTVFLYGGDNRQVRHWKADVNILLGASMRAPGEAVGMLATENAMDEMAEKLGLDPIQFRKLNEPAVDPQEGLPWSSRMLVECMDEGAKRFGWEKRALRPGTRREGEWLIGTGMAAASRKNMLQQSSARVTLATDGSALIETDMTDIGTGTYTILRQIAAEMLGLDPDKVAVKLGDSELPQSPGSGGSWGANSAGSSVYAACEGIIEALAKKLDVAPYDLTLKDGTAIAGNRQTSFAQVLAGEDLVVTGQFAPGKQYKATHQASYGAHFCEVAVNAFTGETRVRRLLTVAAAGRILNEKTATSQCYGGQIFGIGSALHEELVIDTRTGLLVNHDLAEYHVPVNADVPQLEVVLLPERDHAASPLAAKGIGELALSGVGAAVTNAIYNACGVRVRDYPMTLDKVIAGMPRPSFREAAE